MLYLYEAKDGTGRTVTGTVDAEGERAAASQILSQGYFLMRLNPAPNQAHAATAVRQTTPRPDESAPYYAAAPSAAMPQMTYAPGVAGYVQTADPFPEPPKSAWRVFVERVIYPIWSGVSLRDLSVLYRQFAALLNAGVSIPQSLQTLVTQGTRGQLKRSFTEMIQIVQSGGQLSDAMRRYPWIFHESHLAMIIAGEQTGGLDTMFRRLADRLEQEYTVRQTVKKEMVMPILTLFAFFLLPPLFLFFVGNARGYYETAVVPLLQFFGAVGIVYACSRWLAQVRIVTDTIYANVPIIGGVVRLLTYARFARTLATLYASGILVNAGIKYAADASGNTYIGRKILKSLDYLEQGYGITDALAATRAFPPMVISMLSTSEHTGSLDILMDKVADFYDAEAAVKLHQVCVSIGALATVIMGIKVLFLLIKFYSGYYNSLLNMGD